MTTLLALDTATEACSVALLHDGKVISHYEVIPRLHAQRLLPMIKQLLAEAAVPLSALDAIASQVRDRDAIEPELVIREGAAATEIHKLNEEDQDIAILVLAAGGAKEGPGPLVASIAGKGAAFPIPVTVVPYNLTDEDIDSLA